MANYIVTQNNQTCQVALASDLTAGLVAELQAALKEQMQPGVAEVVFDLARTTLLDSSGIGLLIATANTLGRRNGRIRVINVSPEILQLLQSMRLAGRLNATGRE